MQYYLYISDAKLDMLYGQIDKGILSKLEAEILVDLPGLKTTFRDKDNQIISRYDKLRLVTTYLQEQNRIGTVEQPSSYFAGTMMMRWGNIGNGVVYFTGNQDQILVGLGGSLHHVLGSRESHSAEDPLAGLSASQAALILDQLTKVVKQEEQQTLTSPEQLLLERLLNTRDATYALESVRVFARQFQAPLEHVHFLARRLATEERRGQTIMLGTPIFVAFAD